VVFGKNDEDVRKSLSKDDFEFLKQFPNIEIRYESKLHAKYYASEDRALITSMNLHEFSQNNNIEVGILMDVKGLVSAVSSIITLKEDPEYDALEYFQRVIKQATLIFQREPVYETGALHFSKKILRYDITTDNSDTIYQRIAPSAIGFKSFDPKIPEAARGYCIRTGKPIPFNLKRPFADDAYKNWVRFKNEEFPEKFCHFSGESSAGETCYKQPVLRKNWKKMKEALIQ